MPKDKIQRQNSQSSSQILDEQHVVSKTQTDGVEKSACIITDEELQNILNIFEGEDVDSKGKKSEQNVKTPPPSPLTEGSPGDSPPSGLPPAPSPQICSPFLGDPVSDPLGPLHNPDTFRFLRSSPRVARFERINPMNFDERQYYIDRRAAMRPEVELLPSYSHVPSRTISRQGSLNNSHKLLPSQSEVVRSSSNSSSELSFAQHKIHQAIQKQQQQQQQQQWQSPQQSKVQKTGSGTGSASGPLPQAPSPQPSLEQNANKPKKGKKESSKAHQSHSIVEKQRRDRINQLIDELRELIPPQQLPEDNLDINTSKVAKTLDVNASKVTNSRPKHMVLKDTITWVKLIHEELGCLKNDLEIMRANSAGIMDLCGAIENNNHNNNMQSIEDRWLDSLQSASQPVCTMQNNHRNLGVYVEPNPKDNNTMFVKISCKDRQGLLFDIISSFMGISALVKSAVITTDPITGFVNDVFEVTGNAMDGILRDYVQQCVFQSVFFRYGSEGRELKRFRSSDMGRSEEMLMSEY